MTTAKQGVARLDTTRGLDLPATLAVQDIISWNGRIFIQCAHNGLLMKDGDKYFRVGFTPYKPKAAKADTSANAGDPGPRDTDT